MASICSIEGCNRPTLTRGLCKMHYQRVQRMGDPGGAEPRIAPRGLTDEERFWRFVDKSGGPDACWPWTGNRIKPGYGYFTRVRMMPRAVRVHRWAYELLVGSIPEGMTIDHTCHGADPTCAGGSACLHRRCCNPAHMEPVSSRENTLRGNTPAAINAAKTHCVRGHPFDTANTWINPRDGERRCRACARENTARYRARQP